MCEKCICHDCIDRANCFRCDKCNDGNNKIKSCERRLRRELKQCKSCGQFTVEKYCDVCGNEV